MKYDVIVLGSGQAGNPLTQKLATNGLKVAMVEPGPLGGTCVNVGCTPTKTMVSSAQVAHYARDGQRWGVSAENVSVNLPIILQRKDNVVASSRGSWEKKFNGKENPKLYHDKARFVGPRQVQVGADVLEADRIFINTGARPTVPPIPGLDTVAYLTYVTMLDLATLPKHLVILGGGYVGLEFGQMFRRFGSDVTIIQSGSQILPKEDSDIAAELHKALEAEGVRIHLDARATHVQSQGGQVSVSVEVNGGSQTVTGSHLLAATGRTPNTDGMDLQKTGVEVDKKGFVVVDDQLKTSGDNIWALGDVNGGPQFTHISYNDFQIVYGNLYEGKKLGTKARLVPYAVYTDPNLGRVGLTERDARAQGYKLKIGKTPMSSVARAIERDETAGLMKLVVNAADDKILGASILASEGAETVQILSTLMLADKPYTLLKGAIYIHPTLAEGFFSLMESVKPVD